MAWTTPKTNWVKSDYFTYADYNRIKNNLDFLNTVFNEKYPDKAVIIDFGADLDYSAVYYASWFNKFEFALQSFTRIGQDLNIGTPKEYFGNSPMPNADDLNRLESCCLRWKTASDIRVTGVEITPATNPYEIWTKTSYVAEEIQLTAVVYPADATNKSVIWSSSDSTVVRVSNTGLVTRVGHGEAIITCTTVDGGFTDQKTFVVNYGITSARIINTSNTNKYFAYFSGIDQTLDLAIEISPAYATGYEMYEDWTTSNPQYISITDKDGETCTIKSVATRTTDPHYTTGSHISYKFIEPHFNDNIVPTSSFSADIYIPISTVALRPYSPIISDTTSSVTMSLDIEPWNATVDSTIEQWGIEETNIATFVSRSIFTCTIKAVLNGETTLNKNFTRYTIGQDGRLNIIRDERHSPIRVVL